MNDLNINKDGELVIENSNPSVKNSSDPINNELKNIILKNEVFFKKDIFRKGLLNIKTYDGDIATKALEMKARVLEYYKIKYQTERYIKYLDITIVITDKIYIYYKNKKDKILIMRSEIEVGS